MKRMNLEIDMLIKSPILVKIKIHPAMQERKSKME